jgi:hypothetical protein
LREIGGSLTQALGPREDRSKEEVIHALESTAVFWTNAGPTQSYPIEAAEDVCFLRQREGREVE